MSGSWTYLLEIGGGTRELPAGESTVGRSRTCTVRIEDESVSRNHASIICGDGKARVRDLGSSNGTFIGERRIVQETLVLHGAVLRFGNILARFEVASGDGAEETTAAEVACGACGTWNTTDRAACSNCGTPLPGAAIRCGGCGRELPPGSRFCNVCGAEVGREKGAPPPPPPTSRGAGSDRSVERPTRSIAPRGSSPGLDEEVDLPLRSQPLDIGGAARPLPPPGSNAPVGARTAAAAVDLLVILAMELLFVVPAGILLLVHRTVGEAGLGRPQRGLAAILAVLGAGAALLAVAWLAAGWARRGATFGERLFHLAVERPGGDGRTGIGWKRATMRAVVLLAGLVPLGLGSLPVLFRRRPLHDVAARTRVVVSARD